MTTNEREMEGSDFCSIFWCDVSVADHHLQIRLVTAFKIYVFLLVWIIIIWFS